jgi:FtsH-binding integral membrane protein
MKTARTWLVASVVLACAGVVAFGAAFSLGMTGGQSALLGNLAGFLMVACAVLWVVTLLTGTVLLFQQRKKGALEVFIVVFSFAIPAYLFGPNLLSRLGLG